MAPADALETMDAFSLTEGARPSSSARTRQDIGSDIDNETLVLDSDEERNNWFKIAN